jgi:predicted O-methyltransferase YrrM
MAEATWTEVDVYFETGLRKGDPALQAALDHVLSASAAAGLPAIHVSPLQGKFLKLLAELMGARRILEVGTLGGYSTLWLASALPTDGRLVSLELSPHHADVARDNISRAGYGARVEVRAGPAIETLPGLLTEFGRTFDLAFIDADKPSNADYFKAALRLVRPGGAILVDNVVRKGEVADPVSEDPNVAGVRRLVDLIAAEPRASATVLQTVGEKGYDGFLMARILA